MFNYSQNTKYKILNTKYQMLVAAGLLLGIAFLFKIVAIFDLAAFFIFVFITNFPARFNFSLSRIKDLYKKLLIPLFPIIVGFLLPLVVTFIYFLLNHALNDFTQAVFFSNVGYVGYGNKLIIPQGFLILKLILLASVTVFIFLKRTKITRPFMFIGIWFIFSLFNTFFSGRPYTHYTLVILPSLCLVTGLVFAAVKRERSISLATAIFTVILLSIIFKPNLTKSIKYYGNALSFISGKETVTAYQSFFDSKTPRDYEIASFIRMHTTDHDTIFIWGDSAQIYALSDKIPPGKYTVAYHINQSKQGLSQTQSDLDRSLPKYIITLPETNQFPFNTSSYNSKFVFKEAVLYERNF
jgi:hypothetical protein